MGDLISKRWLRIAIPVGLLYPIIGIASAAFAAAAASMKMQYFWRLSAFVISGVVFVAHLAFEHFQLRNPVRETAWHTAFAVALGGFGLALMANIHDLGSTSGYRPKMLIAFVAWPILTAVPAFIIAFMLAAILSLKRQEP